MLANFAVQACEAITGRKLKPMVESKLAQWREMEANGPIAANHTFLY
jgi:hypothetical protein